MNYMTARSRLDRDVLFAMAVRAGEVCCRCGKPLERENFSLDHKVQWRSAPDPLAAFFDVDQIRFAHHRCNSKHTTLAGTTKYPQYAGGKREPSAIAFDSARVYDPEKRRAQYLRTGN